MALSFQEIVALQRAKKAAEAALSNAARNTETVRAAQEQLPLALPTDATNLVDVGTQSMHAPKTVVFNERQAAFIELASDLDDTTPVILVGPAGTGKTTAVGGLIERIMEKYALPPVVWNHKHIAAGNPGIACIAFTRRATNNMRKRLPKAVQGVAVTCHKLLEFVPEEGEKYDEESGKYKRTFHYVPLRDAKNPLPSGLRAIIIDEMSMLGSELLSLLEDAKRENCKLIFVGDMAQLIPVMDVSAVSKYLCKVPTIELTEVYRQAMDSPIIKLATEIRKGITRHVPKKIEEVSPDGSSKLVITPWPKKISEAMCIRQLALYINAAFKRGDYDPENDVILMPFNKADRVGTIALNCHIGTMLAVAADREVYEVVAGFVKKYFSVGDICMWDKEDCVITEIKPNPAYRGRVFQPPSKTLNYFGVNPKSSLMTQSEIDDDEVERLLAANAFSISDNGERVLASSHSVKIKFAEDGSERWMSSAGALNKLDLAYAMSIHKAQGSEWDRVFIFIHESHNVMLTRELLYTGITRAKRELVIACEKDTLITGVLKQAIPGKTLEDKAAHLRLRLKLAAGRVRDADKE